LVLYDSMKEYEIIRLLKGSIWWWYYNKFPLFSGKYNKEYATRKKKQIIASPLVKINILLEKAIKRILK